jgi:hypothetical protein
VFLGRNQESICTAVPALSARHKRSTLLSVRRYHCRLCEGHSFFLFAAFKSSFKQFEQFHARTFSTSRQRIFSIPSFKTVFCDEFSERGRELVNSHNSNPIQAPEMNRESLQVTAIAFGRRGSAVNFAPARAAFWLASGAPDDGSIGSCDCSSSPLLCKRRAAVGGAALTKGRKPA